MTSAGDVYTKLGIRPIINAQGNRTVLGGSTPFPRVKQAMEAAEDSYVVMEELLDKSGDYIAEILGVDGAYVTSGCSAALALSTAACMAGEDPDLVARLPDTTGMKSEVLIQKKQRYSYDRSFTVPGARLVEVGDDDGATVEQLEEAIGPNTAAVAYRVNKDWDDSVISIEDAVEVAHAQSIPVIADAAAQVYPLDYFRANAQAADLVCFGAKYFGAPHSTGFVCGKDDLVRAAVAHGFIAFQHGGRAFARPMKVDRQEIVAVVAAVEAWFTMNHEDRLIGFENRIDVMQGKLDGIPHVQAKLVRNDNYWGAGLKVVLDTDALGKSAQDVADELDAGDPRIWVMVEGDDTVAVNVHVMSENDDAVVAERLRVVLNP